MGTDAYVDVYVKYYNFRTLADIESYIDICKENIDFYQKQIRALAFITEPQKFCSKDEDVPEYIDRILNEAFYNLKQNYDDLLKASLIKDQWEDIMKNKKIEKRIYIED